MMPDRRDVNEVLKAMSEPHRKAIREHHIIQSDIGRRASLIANDEKYQTWIDHLTALRDAAQGRADGLARNVSEGPQLGEALAGMKLMLAGARGELRGLQIALDLIPGLIGAGQRADELISAGSASV